MIDTYYKVIPNTRRTSNAYCDTLEEALEHKAYLEKYFGCRRVEVLKITDEYEGDEMTSPFNRTVEVIKGA